MTHSPIQRALRDALPVVTAYFPIAMTFGALAVNQGVPGWIALLISAWVYAGGAQFMLLSLALSGSPVVATVLAILLVNARHVLYGTALGPAFLHWSAKARWLSAFGLTDEVFALTGSRVRESPHEPGPHLALVFTCYLSWVAGTAAGALIGGMIPAHVSEALRFALPALFLALLFLSRPSGAHLVSAGMGALVATAAGLHQSSTLGIALGAVMGATTGAGVQAAADRRRVVDAPRPRR
ncbi:AzlC family ABC transporter permease [Kyrpidia tusciae]|uniref:AzlC family protein n=1 Tax=Kyrpidia tusciae (strain DSM 2912 / NBRC 15312 / T2) TaxID=562970 RepID=D5WS93_KYRT2|nr:AzlC family ABC transporter permease [Kyrpidia tusciae]ADG04978.1 AzlC family protein [Kyrpidia tusciae DSM 2912]